MAVDRAQWIEQLMLRFSKSLIRYAAGILKDQEAAKEVVQECFMNLLDENPDRFEGDHVRAWLFRECRNRSIDVWRKRRKLEPMTEAHEEALSFQIGESGAGDPLRELETRRGVSGLKEEMRKLSPRHQEALWLKYNDGLSYKEIAEVMRLTPTNVGYILHEAVSRLRDKIAEPGPQDETPRATKRSYGE